MTRYYRRKKAGSGENLRAGLVAGALATSVAAVSFYLARLFLSREVMEPDSSEDRSPGNRAEAKD
ncbi:MAG: hypothetical protein PVJ76_14595 [Gemmatimonadota bacterium]|jgi:hypothetical protein